MTSKFHDEIDHALYHSMLNRSLLWRQIISDSSFATLYPNLLMRTYHYVRQSVPLMRQAQRLIRSADLCPFRAYLEKHIAEEANHDEWLLRDLEALGAPRELATRSLPPPEVCAMVGAQRYLMDEYSPVALLGYMYVLEAYQPRKDTLCWISRTHSIPEAAFSTFLEHSDLDTSHGDELTDFIDQTVVRPLHRDLVLHSARITVGYTHQLLESVRSSFQLTKAAQLA